MSKVRKWIRHSDSPMTLSMIYYHRIWHVMLWITSYYFFPNNITLILLWNWSHRPPIIISCLLWKYLCFTRIFNHKTGIFSVAIPCVCNTCIRLLRIEQRSPHGGSTVFAIEIYMLHWIVHCIDEQPPCGTVPCVFDIPTRAYSTMHSIMHG